MSKTFDDENLPSDASDGLTIESMLAWISSGSICLSLLGPSSSAASSASSVVGASRSHAD